MFLLINSSAVWGACDNGADVCLELQTAEDGVERSLPNVVNTNSAVTPPATDDLVDRITADLKARRLTRPIGNNALQKIQQLKSIDPTHDYAINGVRYVARIYLSMARNDLKNSRVERARARLDAASQTDPSLPGLQAVAEQLNAVSSDSDAITKSTDNNAETPQSPQVTAIDNTELVAAVDNLPIIDTQSAGTLITPVMVGLPAGTFVMGSESGANNEKPAHKVQVDAFSMSRYEITREQYSAFKADTGSEAVESVSSQALLPVSGVTSNEAIAYTRWLSTKTGKRYRLPTEAEWEYAARAGTMTPYHSGDTIFGAANCLTCLDEIPRSARPVGSFEPNTFGLYDMHGNVAEWTSSCLTDNHFGDNERADQLCGKRVVRGGSWRSTRDQVRSSFRLGQASSGRAMDTGIRVVHEGL